MDTESDAYHNFLARYLEDKVPWDYPDPPPEVIALAQSLPPGRLLDVGCGFGRAVIFMAGKGWKAVGVDFIPQAVTEARRRASVAGVETQTEFFAASATELSFLDPPFDVVLDVGCMHSFTDEMLILYRDELARLVHPDGVYLLFAHLRDESAEPSDEEPRGIPEEKILELLHDFFLLERLERGVTQVEDRPPWNSGWFWFRRR